MKNLILYILVSATALSCISKNGKVDHQSAVKVDSFKPHVEMLDSRLEDIVDHTSEVEIIAEGFDWSEGPLWIEGLGLLFSDIPPNKIFLWTAEHGVKLYLTPSGYTGSISRGGEVGSNGLVLDAQGNLVLCQHGDRRIAKMNVTLHDPKPEYTTIVDNYNGKKLNSPNDACFNQAGDLYFTDPPYGLEKNVDDPLKEIPFQGVYKYSRSGHLSLLTDEMTGPNGIAFSPDEKTLYVANSDPKQAHWMSYQLNEEGTIESKQILYDATSLVGKDAGVPDGLKVDANGNIFATGPGGVWIFDSNGKVLGKIRTGQATSNCAIGNNGKVLYITADMYVMKVNLKG